LVRPEPAPVRAPARPDGEPAAVRADGEPAAVRADGELTRDELRRLILDELRELVGT